MGALMRRGYVVRGIGYVPTTRGVAMAVGAENLLGRGAYAREAFAEATAAYFGTPHKGPVDAEDLRRRNPQFYGLVSRVFGPARRL